MISVVINAYAMNPIICCNIVSAKRRRLHQRKNTLLASLAADRFVQLGSAEVVQGVQYTGASTASAILTLHRRKEIINVDAKRQSMQKNVQ